MTKKRICDYAKEVGKSSKEIMGFINNRFGTSIKGASKNIESDWLKELNKHFTPQSDDAGKKTKHDDKDKKPRRLIKRIIRHPSPEEEKKIEKQKIKEEEERKKKKAEEEKKAKQAAIKEASTDKKQEKTKSAVKKKEEPPADKRTSEETKKKEKTSEREKREDREKPKKKVPVPGKAVKKAKHTKYKEPDFEEVKTISSENEKTTIAHDDTVSDTQTKRKKKKKKKKKIDKQKIAQSVEATIKSIKADQTGTKKKYKDRTKKHDGDEEEKEVLRISDHIILSDLAERIDEDPIELIAKAIEMGIMVTINQRLDYDNASIIAMEFGYEVEKIEEADTEDIEETPEEKEEEYGDPRPPVVTIMGHVDHGKTTLIDYLRESRIVDSEHGKITQNIGAYTVKSDIGHIAVIDTPGHEAFTAMRARGAQVTDIAVIIIAANDSVKPQTKEAINHAKLANIPYIIAINKIDLPEADAERVKRDLLNDNIVVEDYGGKIPVVEISAKTGQNVNELIETVILQAELMDLKAPVDGPVKGTVIEVKQDKGLGPVVNCVIQKGTLRKNDTVVAGSAYGKIRKLIDEFGKEILYAGPSTPVTIVGLSELPSVGDLIQSFDNIRKAKDIARQRHLAYREQLIKRREITNVNSYERQLKDMAKKDLNLIIKGKVFGSIEALADSLQLLGNEEVKINVVYKEVGIVTENDINIAIASDARIIAFDTSVSADAKKYAKKEGIQIKQYNIIYDVINDIQKAVMSMNEPQYETVETGRAVVRQMFKFSKTGIISGLYVNEGYIKRNSKIRVEREGEDMGTYTIKSLKRFQDDVKKVESGYECAVILDELEDIAEGDVFVAVEERLIEPQI